MSDEAKTAARCVYESVTCDFEEYNKRKPEAAECQVCKLMEIREALSDIWLELTDDDEETSEEGADCESCENYDACEVDRWQNNDSEGAGE